MEVPEEGIATKENPNLVMSMFEERIVGCICELMSGQFVYTSCLLVYLFTGEEEQNYILWWMIHAGDPVRCQCGRWFKLKKGNPTKLDI